MTALGHRTRAVTFLLVASITGQAGGCKNSKPGNRSTGIAHEGGIPVIPRGQVTLSAARGERYLLEIVAPVEPGQALAFYRSQLVRENWGALKVQRVEKGLWGLRCRRGMFVLTGRIKAIGPGKTSIGFERQVRAAEQAWTPPVQPDVPLLRGTVVWQERVFAVGGGQVELRGRSASPAASVKDALRDALTRAGWSVREGAQPMRLQAERKVPGAERVRHLRYEIDHTRSGCQVRLALAWEELTEGAPRRKAATGRRAAGTLDAGAPAPRPRVRLPPSLRLYPTPTAPLARRLTEKVITVTYERPCTTLLRLRRDVEKRLRARGWKLLPRARLAAGIQPTTTDSVTATRGKLLLVALISRELDTCQVTLTATQK